MSTRHLMPLLIIAGCFAGCTNSQKDSTSDALDTVGTETSSSYNKVRDYMDVGHKDKPAPKTPPVQQRYCYKTYQDVICYAKPIPGEEYRLVGFQTQGGKVGYTLSPEPVPGGDGVTALPPLKSVDVPTPPAIKADDGSDNGKLKEIIFDPSELEPRELVPDKPQ